MIVMFGVFIGAGIVGLVVLSAGVCWLIVKARNR